jgi:ATP-dependent RNA helicase DeaD
MENFKKLGLTQATLDALKAKGFEEPTPIQAKTIPLLLQGKKDIVGQAQTGTGKTAAFGLPAIEVVDGNLPEVQALILTPTRELAVQIAEEMNAFKGTRRLSILPIYGGQSIVLQMKHLRQGAQIVIGTPGRVIDLMNRGKLNLDHVSLCILDEADEMLNMGFIEEVETILQNMPEHRRMVLFSATMPPRIMSLARKYMRDFEHVIAKSEQFTADLTEQIYFEVREADKFEALTRIIDIEGDFYGLIFCRTKIDVDQVSKRLADRGYDVAGIHGDMTQGERERIFKDFKAKRTTILVATDVAARGIDVNDLTHVINYALPQNPESYMHRIGRTGRAGKEGTAITFITPYEYRKLMAIRNITNSKMRKATVPDVAEVIAIKKDRVKGELRALIESGETDQFNALAGEISRGFDHQQVIAALLRYAFEEELDASHYQEIRQVAAPVDHKGKNRLFVALGNHDRVTKPKLVEMITRETRIKPFLIQDIQIYDDFSFISVPFKEAEKIIHAFRHMGRNKKPLVTKAKGKGRP